MLFRSTGKTFEVWNGDEYDARFLDPVRKDGQGLIIGLTNKDNTTKPEEAAEKHNGFFLDYDPERDGETLVIKDQKRLEAARNQPAQLQKKLSLRKAPDTPEFKRFIKDSKVIDEDGNPLIVYHGTGFDFDVFEGAKKGTEKAYFFTEDAELAGSFARTSAAVYEGNAKIGRAHV